MTRLKKPFFHRTRMADRIFVLENNVKPCYCLDVKLPKVFPRRCFLQHPEFAVSMFNVQTEKNRPRMPESDLLQEIAACIAKDCLRDVVTMPANPDNPDHSMLDSDSGRRLPPASFAFKNCCFCVESQSSTNAAYRDDEEHPWDQVLRAHVQAQHGQTLLSIAEKFWIERL